MSLVNWWNQAALAGMQILWNSPEMPFVNRRLEVQFLSPAPYLFCMTDATHVYPSMIASRPQKHTAR